MGLGGLWRWRIGGYRVIARIEDQRITILVVPRGAPAGSESAVSQLPETARRTKRRGDER